MSDRLTAVPPRWSIDIGGAGPLYHRLRLAIEEAILSGKLNEGDPLHPERDLADHVQVSRVTVRKAIDHLVQDGFFGPSTRLGNLRCKIGGPLGSASVSPEPLSS